MPYRRASQSTSTSSFKAPSLISRKKAPTPNPTNILPSALSPTTATMHISGLAMTAALCITSTLSMSIANPRPNPHLPARGPSPSNSPALMLRAGPDPWWYTVPGTTVGMTGTVQRSIGRVAFLALVRAATTYLENFVGHYHNENDLIQEGAFQYIYSAGGNTPLILLENANNHQLTWQVVKTVVEALVNVPELQNRYETTFKIYDGRNQVGKGTLKWMTSGRS